MSLEQKLMADFHTLKVYISVLKINGLTKKQRLYKAYIHSSSAVVSEAILKDKTPKEIHIVARSYHRATCLKTPLRLDTLKE